MVWGRAGTTSWQALPVCYSSHLVQAGWTESTWRCSNGPMTPSLRCGGRCLPREAHRYDTVMRLHGTATLQVWSRSTGFCPTCFPAAPLLSVLCFCVPFQDVGQNLRHIKVRGQCASCMWVSHPSDVSGPM